MTWISIIGPNRWGFFLSNLQNANIKPKKDVLDRIAFQTLCWRYVDPAARSLASSVIFYSSIKNPPATSTKLVLREN
jgi:hypothetical protein